jgi:peptidoglycan/xylan/chitin deacetylase (PgdA/CDA1 family)
MPRKRVRRILADIGSRADSRLPTVRSFLSSGLTVFVFHEITASPSLYQRRSESYTDPDVFKQQIRWIRDRFTIIAPTDLKQLGGTAELPGDAALITFDDAWAGVFRVGLPILEALDVPSLCFLNMATVRTSH